jgi:uncharacterized membrane protein
VKVIALVCAFISLITGLVAAYYWYRASKVGISPGWKLESGEAEKNIMGWVTGCMIAITASGKLNKLAALLTAVSVAFGAISNFLMTFT